MIRDRSSELSFRVINDECTEQLVNGSGVVVVKDSLPLETEPGVVAAYHAARKRMLHRRLASRVMAKAGLGDTSLYLKVQAKDVKADLYEDLPKHKRSAQGAIDALLDVHGQFAERTKVAEVYDGSLEQNLALFALALEERAFPTHQDNQGKGGIAEAAQYQPTQWTIYHVNESGLAVPDYTFNTERGDTVVLAERTGPPPVEAPEFRTGEHTFFEDGSVVHSGINLGNAPRYGLGLFNEQVEEVIS